MGLDAADGRESLNRRQMAIRRLPSFRIDYRLRD
jgi:hypothetical protein